MATGPAADWLEDPTGRFSLRYWDGERYTDWVLGFNGQVVLDRSPDTPTDTPEAPVTEAASGAHAVAGQDATAGAYPHLHSQGTVPDRPHGQAQATDRTTARAVSGPGSTGGAQPQHAGDAVLSFVNKVTLNSLIDRRLANAFWLPPLLELVRERPSDPRTMMWLGIRLQEFERTRSRMRSANLPGSVTGAVLRPVLRPVIRAAGSAMSSGDGKPASQKALSRAWQLLEVRVKGDAPQPADVCLMARNYLAGNQPATAWELAAVATQVQPPRAEAAYILAEAMFECGDHAGATTWAHYATEIGCTLGHSLLRQDTPFRRDAWTTSRSMRGVMPTAADFWSAKARYYEGASQEQLFHFFGPSPLSHGGEASA